MRIGIVLPATPGYSETFFRSKIKGLVSAKHNIIIFAGRSEKKFDDCIVVVAPKVSRYFTFRIASFIWRVLLLLLTSPLRVYRFCKLEFASGRTTIQVLENLYINSHIIPYQIDWLHFGYSTAALRRENVASAIGARMGVSLRGYDISLYPLKKPQCFKLLWEKVDKIHVISSALAANAIKEGCPKTKVILKITPAIDVRNFTRKSNFSELQSPLRIITVARLKWVKGLEYSLLAMAELKKLGIAFHYTIIGDGEEYKRLVFAAYQLNISEHVTFAGRVSHNRIREFMEDADIYLQYSIQEGFGNAVLEAQALGLLCVVSDAQGLPENILNETTGWVVARRNPVLLAEKISQIINLPESHLANIRKNAIDRVTSEFNLEKQLQEFRDFFENHNP